MPYSIPTSPVPSPVKETAPKSKKGFYTPPTHVEDIVSGPMPGIPRRASSRTTSPAMSRSASSNYQSFPTASSSSASRPIEGLPRRSSHTPTPSSVSGLPEGGSSLGLKLHPSPTRAPVMSRGPKDSMSSVSTIESSLPPTPKDEPLELDMTPPTASSSKGGIPFPPFEPISRPLSSKHPLRASMAPSRPPLPSRQHSAGHMRGAVSLQISLPGSASTSHLVPSPVDTRPSRPVHMIRKKSGEVVKPSLKQRSMSTPDLTRSVEDSPDASEEGRAFGEERSKSVRFADSEDTPGSTLANVVLFLQNQRPAAVSKTADGLPDETETEADTDADASDFVHFRTRKNDLARATDDAREIQLEGGSRVPRVRCDFSPDARNALAGEHCVLERAELRNVNGSLCLQGTTIVRNVAFQKWVAVRFTLDHWQTVSEVSGNHVTHVPSATTGDEGWDRFSFNIKLEDYRRKLEERQLLMCIRFSVDGKEWWDSNHGLNYNFNFKRSSPRRTRHSLPIGFNRESASVPSLPGLRQNTKSNFAPSSRIAQQLGGPDKTATTGARDWSFPTLTKGVTGGPLSPSLPGTESPKLSPPPVTAYRPPNPPDVHTHLQLKSYCAPSPPTSPPKEETFAFSPSAMTLSPDGLSPANRSPSLNIVGGQPATTLAPPVHERRSSWNGKSGSWDSFAKVMDEMDQDSSAVSTNGSTTPVAKGARSPSMLSEETQSPSPVSRPLTMKRSTGNLQALRNGEAGLMTPPSSHSSSPSPTVVSLPLPEPELMSPTHTSSSTTGDSSPVNTVASDSTPDLANLQIDIDPSRSNASHRLLNNASYQEFLDKFCFFQSPRSTPNVEDLPPRRKNYVHVSGHTSPAAGFPFYAAYSNSSSSPHDTPTPRREYDSAQDAFGHLQPSGQQTPSTPRPSPGHSSTPSRSDIPGPLPTNPTAWASGQLHSTSPSLTAK